MERPDSLDTSDISGAQARPLPVRRTDHPFNTNLDIVRSSPYEFSRGTLGGTAGSLRCTDALNPAYKLPSYEVHPLPPPTSQPRDNLWTLPQKKWRPQPREDKTWGKEEMFGRHKLFMATIPPRAHSLQVQDICGPQFRCEEPRWRKTDPLHPVYVYDGGPVDRIIP